MNYYLRSWVIEGSMDGKDNSWVVIGTRRDDTQADANHPIGTFTVANSEASRFIRLRQTGHNARGDDFLILFAFEMFGVLIG
jgi:hypothetical protein